MDNPNESKAERFVRLAEPRVSKACKAISLMAILPRAVMSTPSSRWMRCLPLCRTHSTRHAPSIARVRTMISGFK